MMQGFLPQCTLTGHSGSVLCLAFRRDGLLASGGGSGDHSVKLWRDGSCVCTMTGHSGYVHGVAWSTDGSTLASCSADKTVRTWSRYGSPLSTLTGHGDTVSCLAFSPSGLLVSGSWDKTIKGWGIRTGALLWTVTGHSAERLSPDEVLSVAFGPDDTLASGSADNSIEIWRVGTGTRLRSLRGHDRKAPCVCTEKKYGATIVKAECPVKGHSSSVCSVAISGNIVASGSFDKTVRLWDITNGKPIGSPFFFHVGGVWSIAISGNLLASGSSDRTVRLWDIRTGNPVGPPLTGHSARVRSVALASPWFTCVVRQEINISSQHEDKYQSRFFVLKPPCLRRIVDFLGVQLASASEDKTVKIWHISTNECQSWAMK